MVKYLETGLFTVIKMFEISLKKMVLGLKVGAKFNTKVFAYTEDQTHTSGMTVHCSTY